MTQDLRLTDPPSIGQAGSVNAALDADHRAEFGSPSLRGPRRAGIADQISAAEIGQLVSVALEDALIALGKVDPERFLRLRARQAQAEMRGTFACLPHAQRSDATVVSEYRKAISLRNLTSELALELVSVIERYVEACDLESASAKP